MREIKFRGKNYGGIWLYGYLMPAEKPVINKGCKYRISVSPHACAGKDKIVYEVITDTIGQFTGLKDKNGIEIYENDVIKADCFLGEPSYIVKWDVIGARFVFVSTESGGYLTPRDFNFDYVEVIGNTTDKPEMTKY